MVLINNLFPNTGKNPPSEGDKGGGYIFNENHHA